MRLKAAKFFHHLRRVSFLCALVVAVAGAAASVGCASSPVEDSTFGGEPTDSLELSYADQFGADFYGDDYTLIDITDGQRFLLVAEGAPMPEGVDEDIIVLQQPLDNLYVAASAAMDSFVALDALGDVGMTSTTADNWAIPEIKNALEDGFLTYAGKYSAPDYELLLSEGSDLAIESTMIYHSPETQEQLESLGIPVLVERSSYEADPLGRLEWIKFYGLLTGRLEEAEAFFNDQMAELEPILQAETDSEGPKVAFFSISSNGNAVVRKPGDYITKMIEMAGGRYILEDEPVDDNNLSTMNMQMEAFYEQARDADIIIYNSTIDGELATLDDLLDKSELLADFKAVQNGNVWDTGKNFYQQTTGLGTLLSDLNQVITGEADGSEDLTFLHHLS